MWFDGEVALVTGASRGIGRAIAVELARRGADLALVQRGEADGTASDVLELGRTAHQVTADLADPRRAADAVDLVVEEVGHLEILVCNAARIVREDALEVDVHTWGDVVALDLVTPFAMAQAAARQFARHRVPGRIVLVSSVLGFQGGIRVSAYAAAKAGLVNLARSLSNEWAPLGIRVNAVAPGYIETEQTAPVRADPVRKAQLDDRIPAGRWGRPEDVSGAVAFLAGPDAGYVHGHTLVVDGGWLGR
jgi:2-deoxy-D-gluconate 3-dehydrogenase